MTKKHANMPLFITALALLLVAVARTLAPGAPGEIETHVLEPPSELGELQDVIWSGDGTTVGLVGMNVKTALFRLSPEAGPEFIETIAGRRPQLSPSGRQMLTMLTTVNHVAGRPSAFMRHFPGSSRELEYIAHPGPLAWLDEETVMAYDHADGVDQQELTIIDINQGDTSKPGPPFLPVKYREPFILQLSAITSDNKRTTAMPVWLKSGPLALGHIQVERENQTISIISSGRRPSFTVPKAYRPITVVGERYLLATGRFGHQLRLSVFDLSGERSRIDLGDFTDIAAASSGHIIIEDDEGRRYLTRFRDDRLGARRELRFIDRGGNRLTPVRVSLSPNGSRVVFATARGTRLLTANIRAD